MSSKDVKRQKILITHNKIPQSALDIFKDKSRYELIISKSPDWSAPSRETILHDIKGVDAVMWFGHVHVDKEMLDAAGSQLKVIGSMGAGYDHINVKLLKERNIKVSNTPNILASAVADMGIALVLAVSRNLIQGYNAIRKGKWVGNHPTWMCGPALEGSTVGIIGFGAVGAKIAKRIKSFDIEQLLYHSSKEKPDAAAEVGAKFVTLDELLEKSDFIFLSVPLTPQTKHFFNLEKFRKMKRTSIVINISRGDVMNQDDLVTALTTNLIGGAGLDVMTPEPLPSNHPLTELPNVVLSPHIGSATFRARETMAKLAAQNIYNALTNENMLTPINV